MVEGWSKWRMDGLVTPLPLRMGGPVALLRTATTATLDGKALRERMFGFCSVTVTVVTVKKWDTILLVNSL